MLQKKKEKEKENILKIGSGMKRDNNDMYRRRLYKVKGERSNATAVELSTVCVGQTAECTFSPFIT